MILEILLWAVAIYLLIGAVTCYLAISFMLKTNDPDFARSRGAWRDYSMAQKAKAVCTGLVIWLPAALGLKRSAFFK